MASLRLSSQMQLFCFLSQRQKLIYCHLKKDADSRKTGPLKTSLSLYGTPYMALVVEGWKSGVTKIHDYVKSYIAPFPMRKFKTKSLRKHNRDDKKNKNKKKKGKNKNTHDLQVQLQFQNEEQLNFRLTNIYDSRQLNQEQDNTYEKSINIY